VLDRIRVRTRRRNNDHHDCEDKSHRPAPSTHRSALRQYPPRRQFCDRLTRVRRAVSVHFL